MPFLLLSAGRDPALLRRRNAQLLAAGFKVCSASDAYEVVEKLLDGDFDLVLLCDSISNRDRELLVHIIASYTPSTPIVLISRSDGGEQVVGNRVVSCPPEQLLPTVMESLRRLDLHSAAAQAAS